MKAFVRGIAFILLFLFLFVGMLCAIPDQFGNAFHRAVVRQYDYFKSLQGEKIVFIGSSSLSFSLDLDLMEELVQRPCAILGNTYGTGLIFQTEIAKSNLSSGDIVVVEYQNYAYNTGESELLLSAVGKRYDMHRYYPKELLGKILEGYPSYFIKNLNYWRSWPFYVGLPYDIAAYDERGNMSFIREECEIPEEFSDEVAERYGWADFYSMIRGIDYRFVERLNEFVLWCKDRNIKIYFIVPVVYEAAVPDYCDRESVNAYDDAISSVLAAPLISHSADYIFPREFIYESIQHCTTAGAEVRTQLLYRDLQPYLAETA